jgi:signal transduction histidine kinase
MLFALVFSRYHFRLQLLLELEFIFERFYRSDESRNKNTGGSGIGLTITKAIVEAHRGTINVHSIIGKGSTFILTFPKSALSPNSHIN